MDQSRQTELAFKSVRSQPDMSEVFDEGGITDDGLDVDPISGNEIPAGSMAEEVRDDIPANLSGGEYVVPADVLRFYGVKFFEELRAQAKMGLNQMEDEGRIGGEPVGMEGDEQTLSMEEEAELDAIMGMAMGGLTGEPYSTNMASAPNPTNPEMPMYDPMANNAVQNNTAGYAEGGEVPANTQFTPDFSKVKAGFSFMGEQAAAVQTPTSKNVTLYGPNGEVKNLILPTDKTTYDQLIAQGYSTQPTAASAASVGSSGSSRSDRSRPSIQETQEREPLVSISEMTDDQLMTSARGLRVINKVGQGISALGVGLIPSAIIGTQTAARYNDMLEELDRREVEHEFDRQSSIFGGERGPMTGLQDVNGDGKESFGDTWLGDLLGFDGQVGNQGPTLRESKQGARRGVAASSPSTISSSSSSSSGGFWKAITGRTFNETFGGGGNNTPSSTPSSPSSSTPSRAASSTPSSPSSSSSSGGLWKALTGKTFKETFQRD
jgi:hypothetical protein